MFSTHHHPHKISKKELDRYLSQGWFRMGQSIFTCYFLHVRGDIYSTVWIRLELTQHQFSKSQRKVIRKVENNFNIKISKAVFDIEKELLYKKYKKRFEEPVAASIKASLMDGLDFNIYDTYEVTIYDGDQLIGVSFFDIGENSIASIMGIYDPDYSRYSLGYYTMLREINFCLEHNMEYYYPGYIVPGYQRFNYKLRIGNVEYFSPEENRWRTFKEENIKKLQTEQLKKRMESLFLRLDTLGIPMEMMFFPNKPVLFSLIEDVHISSPICILCHREDADDYSLIIDYHSPSETFHLYRAGIVLKPLFNSKNEEDIILKIKRLYPHVSKRMF